mmetsp:Transcript_18946/g.46927  ORF Transcript_18946/g.46927 Transcript_18946/m.46927 type:complete len:462 (+) Transcript_18946:103-1488(+)
MRVIEGVLALIARIAWQMSAGKITTMETKLYHKQHNKWKTKKKNKKKQASWNRERKTLAFFLALIAWQCVEKVTMEKKLYNQRNKRKKNKKKWSSWNRERRILYDQHTSYSQVYHLGGVAPSSDHDDHPTTTRMNASITTTSKDDFYRSDAIPWKLRNKAAGGKECREYFVHHNYGDGFGHQLADIAAAMVLHLLNRDQLCFLGIEYYEGDYKQFDHECTSSCQRVYNTLSRQWPGIDYSTIAKTNRTIHKFDSTNIWEAILAVGGERKYRHVPCYLCDKARMTVAHLWVDVVKKMAAKRNIPTLDVAIHLRKGDFPRYVPETYTNVIDGFFPFVPLDIFTENSGEASELLMQLNRTHEVRIHEGGDAAEDWLKMAKARVLFVHESSFSISASIASEGIIFSQEQKPYQGRYDNHYFPCRLKKDGWWVSTGLHGNPVCDGGKIHAISMALVEKHNISFVEE